MKVFIPAFIIISLLFSIFRNSFVISDEAINLQMIKNMEAGGSNNNTTFLKKLLVMSQMQMNNALEKLSNQPRNFLENPSLPGITQFKPSGTSNIFSPLIDIRTHDATDEDKFTKAYEKGFSEAMGRSSSGPTTINYGDEETKINQTITDSYKSADKDIIDIDNSIVGSDIGNKTSVSTGNSSSNSNNSNRNQGNTSGNSQNSSSTNSGQNNGFSRGNNNGRLGIPGYSYLEPRFFDVPQERTPVCHQTKKPERGVTSLEPAGYLSSGNSNVMEFHGVGSILPRFRYNEETTSAPDETNRY